MRTPASSLASSARAALTKAVFAANESPSARFFPATLAEPQAAHALSRLLHAQTREQPDLGLEREQRHDIVDRFGTAGRDSEKIAIGLGDKAGIEALPLEDLRLNEAQGIARNWVSDDGYVSYPIPRAVRGFRQHCG